MLITLALSPAFACGGFFCNNIEPIEQKGEKIVFEVDKDQDQTTMHVQVEYQGPPSEFAWVIPVKGTPDLQLSNEALFTRLDSATRPQFMVEYDATDDTCNWFWGFNDVNFNASVPPPAPAGGVDVLAQAQVGPYDTVVVAATDTDALITWLQANEYAIPDGMAAVIAPYLAEGHNFVGLRLSSGQTTGDLEPLALTYRGTEPAIPLHLTSVAAADDMPLKTWVLADSRAVPDNYLHVEINHAAINWFSWSGDNYDEVVTRAADQAGGHAFATDHSGSTDEFHGRFYPDGVTTVQFAQPSAELFIDAVLQSGIPASGELLAALEAIVPIPEGTDARSVYNNPSSFSTELAGWFPQWSAATNAAAFDVRILEPLREIEEMFHRQPHITRMSSSISPHEMTLDPIFTLNADIEQDVSSVHVAQVLMICDEDAAYDEIPALLTLPDGNVIELPSQQTLQEMELYDWGSYLAQLDEPAASEIASFESEGPREVVFDGSREIERYIQDLNDETDDVERAEGSKGCSTANSFSWTGLLSRR